MLRYFINKLHTSSSPNLLLSHQLSVWYRNVGITNCRVSKCRHLELSVSHFCRYIGINRTFIIEELKLIPNIVTEIE